MRGGVGGLWSARNLFIRNISLSLHCTRIQSELNIYKPEVNWKSGNLDWKSRNKQLTFCSYKCIIIMQYHAIRHFLLCKFDGRGFSVGLFVGCLWHSLTLRIGRLKRNAKYVSGQKGKPYPGGRDCSVGMHCGVWGYMWGYIWGGGPRAEYSCALYGGGQQLYICTIHL